LIPPEKLGDIQKTATAVIFIPFDIMYTNDNSTTIISLSPPESEVNRMEENKILFILGHTRFLLFSFL
jgi:hypothetical protein